MVSTVIRLGWVWILVLNVVQTSREGEFIAGSFILSQKSLNEAPYRYAGILRKALDTVEQKQPPTQSDEENCDVRYRIEPSGRRSVLKLEEDTLAITLKESNTVVITANVYVEVAARTWIWKGINFGFLGCLKMNSCRGQIVTYTSHVDFQIAFKVLWDHVKKKMTINIKPVNTELTDVNVIGCKPPWYLWWFKKWQKLLNQGVQEAFEQFAEGYEHQTEVPEEFSPLKGVYIKYVITDMSWSKERVIFQANASFLTTVNNKNLTFIPEYAPGTVGGAKYMDWNSSLATEKDGESHLLQGVRISTEFLNSLMWYASVTNVTKYNDKARILDSYINGTMSYTPPLIKVKENDLLSINIRHGLLLASCKPVDNATSPPETLFKAEFSDLAGSGKINLASTRDQTGIRVSLDNLDLSRLNTKPFEPKLPLPESFENELMKNAISQLQPVINNYLKSKPLYLPDNVAPFAASPQLKLWNMGNGTGYAEMLSYCTCSRGRSSSFATCDARSQICDDRDRGEHQQRGEDKNENQPDQDRVSFGKELGDAVKTGFKNLVGIAHGIITNEDADNHNDDDDLADREVNVLNFTAIFERSKQNLSYVGSHFTLFEEDQTCQLSQIGSSAKVYWLWRTSQCTPMYLKKNEIDQYYYYLDQNTLKFGCDRSCKFCEIEDDNLNAKEACKATDTGHSYHLITPDVDKWTSSNLTESVIANVFFNDDFCAFLPRYVEPQLLSSHTNLGSGNDPVCTEWNQKDSFSTLIFNNDSASVKVAYWECFRDCFGCLFRLRNASIGYCTAFDPKMKIVLTRTLPNLPPDLIDLSSEDVNNMLIYSGAIVSSILLVSLVMFIGIYVWKRKNKSITGNDPRTPDKFAMPHIEFPKNKSLNFYFESIKEFSRSNLGFRLNSAKSQDGKLLRDDILQNFMLVINATMSIVFAVEWNSDNNPLLIIHNKFKSGLTISVEIFDTFEVTNFVDRLNFLTLLANVVNALFSFGVVLCWIFTTTGDRNRWMKARLMSSISLLGSIFIVIAMVIFTTYFDDLVVLEKDKGLFITDNDSMHSIATKVIKVSLNGLSLTVISFTIVFLFHGVGGGLYCGNVLFRIVHIQSKRSNLEILSTLLVILTVIQPFICLHPVIIWSQDSNHNSTFLLLIIFVWFLPIIVHMLVKAVMTHVRPKYELRLSIQGDDNVLAKRKQSEKKAKYMLIFDMAVQLMQLAFFLATFAIVTYHIINTEFNKNRKNLQDFVLPAIMSVFFWMMSTSYLLLSLVVEKSTREPRLIFKDQDLKDARNRLRQSLKKRLAEMDRNGSRFRARTLQRHQDLKLDESQTSLSKSVGRQRQTLPTNIDLSESMRGRKVLPDDLATVRVQTKAKNSSKGQEQIRMKAIRSIKPSDKYLAESQSSINGNLEERVEIMPDSSDRNRRTHSDLTFDEDKDSEIEIKMQTGFYANFIKAWNFLLENKEYRDPITFGWRIKFRRLFLTAGVVLFSCLTIHTIYSTQDFSSKKEIQKILDYAGTNLTWPDQGSVLDDVFDLYNSMARAKSYIMIASSLLFWMSLILDFASHFTILENRRSIYFTGSRLTNFFGSLAVFASVIIVGLPDYLEASHLDDICPFCGHNFNLTVRQVAEFTIGLFFACLFSFQLIPILITIVPALVRASVLILVHPSLQIEENEATNLRMTILQQVIQFSSLLTFPITFVAMAIVQQYQKDVWVSLLILTFWTVPPLVLFVGLFFTRKYKRYAILLYIYYLYNFLYFMLLFSLLIYALSFQRILELLNDMMKEPTLYAGSISQVFLCNVVISDMLYMTVF